eukprot:1157352-Pelagomonas_calceolata.AAC.8
MAVQGWGCHCCQQSPRLNTLCPRTLIVLKLLPLKGPCCQQQAMAITSVPVLLRCLYWRLRCLYWNAARGAKCSLDAAGAAFNF